MSPVPGSRVNDLVRKTREMLPIVRLLEDDTRQWGTVDNTCITHLGL